MFELSDLQIIRSERTILTIDQLSIPDSELTVILGHNGSGKSTLVSLLAGQMTPDTGSISLNGHDISSYKPRDLAKQIAFLPQKLPASAGLTVRELVKLARFPWRGALGRWRKADDQIVDQAMEHAGVSAFASVLADHLSGGERQRAWVAMLLAQQSPILILDEPTSALDIQHQYQLMQLLSQLQRTQGVGIIVILHDLNLALRFATHIVALKKGRVDFAGSAQLLNDEPRLSALYDTPIKLIDHPDHALSAETQGRKVAIVCV